MEQFLRALERVEGGTIGVEGSMQLSGRMREVGVSARVWFDYGIWKRFDVDAVY